MIHHSKTKNILFLICLISVITGCADSISNGAKQAQTYEKRHEIKLTKTDSSLEIPIVDSGYISQAEEANIKSFLYKYDNYGKSNLIITAPEVGVEAGTARALLKQIVNIAQKVGIKKDSIKLGTYQALDNNNLVVRMNFETITAKAPDCSGSWSKNLADAYHNDLSKGHGCTRKNFAAMIADPEDIVRMRDMGIGNAARRVDIFDKYVAGATPDISASSTDQ
jgi:pilus biogenesis lipoprotein CpaD